ncbi:cobalt ABC transporter permease, partial [Clostridium botulinum]|nr:cobalt ABC transporter permease [Clostridium botulinum]
YMPYLDRNFDFSYIRFLSILIYIILILLLVIFFK